MKLQAEKENVLKSFREKLPEIKAYAEKLKAAGGYKDFSRRLTFDILHGLFGSKKICEWYEKYGVNDNHVYTLGKTCLKELGVI